MEQTVAWKSELCLVSQEQIELLFPALLDAEKREWIASCSPVSSSSCPGGSENGDTAAGVGLQILRHGKIVKEIHDYFQRFESHRYRSALTNKKRNPDPDNTIRVVKNDSSLEQRTPVQEGLPSNSHSSDQPFDEKNPDFVLYEKALLCAMYPVLSTPAPASPYSPSPSPITSPTSTGPKRFSSFGSGGSRVSSPPVQGLQRRFSFSTERTCVSPEVSVPIDSEVLKDLVRKAFGLNVKKHRFYIKMIERKNNPKSPERLLVEELLMQLSMLESNHHPYYGVHTFMDRNAYNEWLIHQKEKIQALIKSFWHHPQPPIPALPLNMSERHTEYHDLMLRLIRHESGKKQLHPVYGNTTPSAPLSVETCRLLHEFGLRFGVGELYCKIVYLSYLVQYFENDLWYIEHVTAVLHSVMDLVPISQEILVKKEFAMLLELLGLLQKHTKYSLTRIKRLFPGNTPAGGVSALVTLMVTVLEATDFLRSTFPAVFSTLVEARAFVEGLDDEPVECLLSKYLKVEMEGRYERGKVRAMDELNAQFLTHSVSPQLLNMLILNIRDEVNSYCNLYQQEFARFFNMEELGATTFYKRLMSDVEELISNPRARNAKRDRVDVCLLSLAFRLSQLDQDWEKYIPLSFQTWRQPFLVFANTWLDAIGCRLQRVVTMTIQRDEWKEVLVRVDKSRDSEKKTGSRRVNRGAARLLHSYPPLTPSEHSAFRVVRSPPNSAKDDTGSKGSMQSRDAATEVGQARKSARRRPTAGLGDSDSSSDDSSSSGVRTVTAQVHVHNEKPRSCEKESKAVQEAERDIVEKSGRQSTEDINGLPERNESVSGVCDEAEGTIVEKSDGQSVEERSGVPGSNRSVLTNSQRDLKQSDTRNGDSHETCEKQGNREDTVDDDSESRSSPIDSDSTEYGSSSDSIHSSDSFNFIEDYWGNNRPAVSPVDFSVEVNSNVNKPTARSSITSHQENCESSARGKNEQVVSSDLQSTVDDTQHDHSKAVLRSETVEPSLVVHKTGPQLSSSSNDKFDRTKNVEECSKNECSSCPERTSVCVEIEDGVASMEEKPTLKTTTGDSHKGSNRVKELQQAQGEETEHGLSASLDIPRSSFTRKKNRKLFSGVTQARHSDQSSLRSASTEYESFHSPIGSFKTARETTTNSSSSASVISNEERSKPSKNSNSSLASSSDAKSGQVNSDNPREELAGVTREAVLPVSSSFVDVICVVNRLVSFACHVCKILCPDERPPRGDYPTSGSATTDLDDVQIQSAVIKRELCQKLIQVLTSFIQSYTIRVVRMDSCGLSEEELQHLVGVTAWEDLYSAPGSTRCSSCRHNPKPRLPCNTTHPTSGKLVPPCEPLTRAKQMPGGCEPVTQEMGVRISNLVALENLLSWIRNYAQVSLTHPDSLASGFYGNSMGSAKSWTYCQFGPSLDGKNEQAATTETAAGSEGDAQDNLCGAEEVNHCKELLQRMEGAQIKLLAYRMNMFFRKALKALLSLTLPTFDVDKRLQPGVEFLQRELRCFNSVLYPESFQKLLVDLWSFITQDFMEEVDSLRDMKAQAPEQAKLILRTTGLLMQFFHGLGEGLALEKLSRPMEPVLKHLELYNTRTDRLIYMYGWLCRQVLVTQQQYRADDFVSSISTTSHHSVSRCNSPADFLIQSLCEDLHTMRKCFSGTVFVEWVKNYVREHGYDNLGVYIGSNDTDTGVELGNYLLQRKLIVCVAPPPKDVEEEPTNIDEDEELEGTSPNRREVYYPSDSPAERLNNIDLTQPRSSGTTSRISSRSTTTTPPSYDDDESDSDDPLEPGDIFCRTDSTPSDDMVFHNRPDAFYTFISDEEVDGGEFKFKLDFADRLNVKPKLMQIICVLHTRKQTDRAAKSYLKRITSERVAEALGREQKCRFFFCG